MISSNFPNELLDYFIFFIINIFFRYYILYEDRGSHNSDNFISKSMALIEINFCFSTTPTRGLPHALYLHQHTWMLAYKKNTLYRCSCGLPSLHWKLTLNSKTSAGKYKKLNEFTWANWFFTGELSKNFV